MCLKLSHDKILAVRRMAQIDRRLSAVCGATGGDLAGREIHVNPAALFMPVFRVIGLGLCPDFVQRPYDNRVGEKLTGRRWSCWQIAHRNNVEPPMERFEPSAESRCPVGRSWSKLGSGSIELCGYCVAHAAGVRLRRLRNGAEITSRYGRRTGGVSLLVQPVGSRSAAADSPQPAGSRRPFALTLGRSRESSVNHPGYCS